MRFQAMIVQFAFAENGGLKTDLNVFHSVFYILIRFSIRS